MDFISITDLESQKCTIHKVFPSSNESFCCPVLVKWDSRTLNANKIEGITHQPPKPPSRLTWILETLTPQIRKINAIFAMFRVFSIVWKIFRTFKRLSKIEKILVRLVGDPFYINSFKNFHWDSSKSLVFERQPLRASRGLIRYLPSRCMHQ
jgi:hypothetical protein